MEKLWGEDAFNYIASLVYPSSPGPFGKSSPEVYIQGQHQQIECEILKEVTTAST